MDAIVTTDWLAAQMTWEEVGASYDSFGDLGQAVDGLPDGLPGGVADPQFVDAQPTDFAAPEECAAALDRARAELAAVAEQWVPAAA